MRTFLAKIIKVVNLDDGAGPGLMKPPLIVLYNAYQDIRSTIDSSLIGCIKFYMVQRVERFSISCFCSIAGFYNKEGNLLNVKLTSFFNVGGPLFKDCKPKLF